MMSATRAVIVIATKARFLGGFSMNLNVLSASRRQFPNSTPRLFAGMMQLTYVQEALVPYGLLAGHGPADVLLVY